MGEKIVALQPFFLSINRVGQYVVRCCYVYANRCYRRYVNSSKVLLSVISRFTRIEPAIRDLKIWIETELFS